jgi:multicomponent Na+:H+ antiporter subunit D
MILPSFIIIPLAVAFLITLLARKKEGGAALFSIVAAALLVGLSVYAAVAMKGQTVVYEMSAWKIPFGIALVLDSLTAFMLLIVNLIALTSLAFSFNYVRHLWPDWKYYSLFMILLAGMNGVIMTGDLFNLYVFMEIALLAAFALVAYGGRSHEFEASFKYAVMGAVSSGLILFTIAIVYSSTSTLTLAKIAEAFPGLSPSLQLWIGGLLLAGLSLKAAVMPFHAWLPDAHSSAPAPISAMLSGVLIKTLGIYTLIRIFYNVMGAPQIFLQIFLVLGVVSILLGNALAVKQWDFKRLLAYCSIGQVGYIFLALGLNSVLGMVGALFHLFSHALSKSLLFYNAGAIEMGLGTRDLRNMGNITRLMPVTAHTSMVASLAISGIPPFNGFFSKLIIIIAVVQAGGPFYALAAVVGSLLTLAAFMKVQKYGIRGEKPAESLQHSIGWGMKTAMIVLALLCVLTSLMVVPGIRETTLDPVVDAIMNKTGYIQLVLGGK